MGFLLRGAQSPQTPPLNGRPQHLIEAAKRGRFDQMLFFSAPLTTLAPSTTVRPDVRPDIRPNVGPIERPQAAERPAEHPAERPPNDPIEKKKTESVPRRDYIYVGVGLRVMFFRLRCCSLLS